MECAVLEQRGILAAVRPTSLERTRAAGPRDADLAARAAEVLDGRQAPDGLDPQFRALFDAADGDRARKRVIVDQIASLTDASARSLHARLTGHP
ncbi:deoxyguanosinetriphosphate triphosphohydrolase [Streptomyces violaceorubidus]